MSNVRNEIKAQIVRAGFTMQEVVDRLAEEHDWSDSVSNLSAKLQRESIRYKEVIELADVLGYDIVWQTGWTREKGRGHFSDWTAEVTAVTAPPLRRSPRRAHGTLQPVWMKV